ncbi:MAG TPA: hypothetical protein VM029_00600 [Opitutaceae bacterium]|nr:hypothetical protein [Opitutaceae bacterium]
MNHRSMFAAASVSILLSACGGIRPRPRPQEETRLKVPYTSDRREQWGPAAVADVLNFWGHPVELKTLRREIHFTRKPEDVARDLETVGRGQGFKAELAKGDLPAIKREIDAGRPLIVLVNTGFGWLPVRSYVVITGYSDYRRCLYAHWGPNKDFFVSYRQFAADWRKSGNWLLRVSGAKAVAKQPAVEPAPVADIPPPPEITNPPEPPVVRPRSADVRLLPPAPPEPPTASENPMPEMLWLSP